MAICGLWLLLVVVGLVYTPHDPLEMHLENRLAPPGGLFLLGTDQYGRDLLSRILAASAISFFVCALTTFLAVCIGGLVGALSGYAGKKTDKVIVMLLDSIMAFPPLLLVLLFLTVMGPSVQSIIIALGIAYIPTAARVMRSTVLSLKQKEYIEACRVLGKSHRHIILHHIVPNTISPMLVLTTTMFATVLLLESALSFLGLGVAPPAATWGGLLADSRQFLAIAPWLSIMPGALISISLLGICLLGDGLRDKYDPKTNT